MAPSRHPRAVRIQFSKSSLDNSTFIHLECQGKSRAPLKNFGATRTDRPITPLLALKKGAEAPYLNALRAYFCCFGV